MYNVQYIVHSLYSRNNVTLATCTRTLPLPTVQTNKWDLTCKLFCLSSTFYVEFVLLESSVLVSFRTFLLYYKNIFILHLIFLLCFMTLYGTDPSGSGPATLAVTKYSTS